MSKYGELLKDPRWQKRRLEIMSRDGFQCACCLSDSSMLSVHHKYYEDREYGFMPWDYPDDALITLCEECHSREHEALNLRMKDVIYEMYQKRGKNALAFGLYPVFTECDDEDIKLLWTRHHERFSRTGAILEVSKLLEEIKRKGQCKASAPRKIYFKLIGRDLDA